MSESNATIAAPHEHGNRTAVCAYAMAAAVDRQINELYDALALIKVLIGRLPDRTVDQNNEMRLAQMAAEKIEAAIGELDASTSA